MCSREHISLSTKFSLHVVVYSLAGKRTTVSAQDSWLSVKFADVDPFSGPFPVMGWCIFASRNEHTITVWHSFVFTPHSTVTVVSKNGLFGHREVLSLFIIIVCCTVSVMRHVCSKRVNLRTCVSSEKMSPKVVTDTPLPETQEAQREHFCSTSSQPSSRLSISLSLVSMLVLLDRCLQNNVFYPTIVHVSLLDWKWGHERQDWRLENDIKLSFW